jgi:predicted amidohydrolase YtcJ
MKGKVSDIIFKNGSVYTVDNHRTWAQAIAIAGERIVFVGTNEGVEAYNGAETIVIDLEGKMVLPGFVDAHALPSHAMDFVCNINLYMLDTLEDYKRTIAEYVTNHPNTETLRGGGWSDTLFFLLAPIIGGSLVQFWSYNSMFLTALILTVFAFGIIKFSVKDPRRINVIV